MSQLEITEDEFNALFNVATNLARPQNERDTALEQLHTLATLQIKIKSNDTVGFLSSKLTVFNQSDHPELNKILRWCWQRSEQKIFIQEPEPRYIAYNEPRPLNMLNFTWLNQNQVASLTNEIKAKLEPYKNFNPFNDGMKEINEHCQTLDKLSGAERKASKHFKQEVERREREVLKDILCEAAKRINYNGIFGKGTIGAILHTRPADRQQAYKEIVNAFTGGTDFFNVIEYELVAAQAAASESRPFGDI